MKRETEKETQSRWDNCDHFLLLCFLFVSVFLVFSFTSIVDLMCALELEGYIKGFMDFYINKVNVKHTDMHTNSLRIKNKHYSKHTLCLVQGEPYLNTAHCIMKNYWNGGVHFVLLLAIIHRMRKG